MKSDKWLPRDSMNHLDKFGSRRVTGRNRPRLDRMFDEEPWLGETDGRDPWPRARNRRKLQRYFPELSDVASWPSSPDEGDED